jgi:hypothetical protein
MSWHTRSLEQELKFYKVVQIWPGRFVCKQVTVFPGHIWTTLYLTWNSSVWEDMCVCMLVCPYHWYKFEFTISVKQTVGVHTARPSVVSTLFTLWLSLNPRASWLAAYKGYYVQKFCRSSLHQYPTHDFQRRLLPTQTSPKSAIIHVDGNAYITLTVVLKIK